MVLIADPTEPWIESPMTCENSSPVPAIEAAPSARLPTVLSAEAPRFRPLSAEGLASAAAAAFSAASSWATEVSGSTMP